MYSVIEPVTSSAIATSTSFCSKTAAVDTGAFISVRPERRDRVVGTRTPTSTFTEPSSRSSEITGSE